MRSWALAFALSLTPSLSLGARVQTGTATSNADGTTTATITAVDPAKAFLIFSTRHASNRPVGAALRGSIANATTLEFVRDTDEVTPVPITIRWFVVDYTTGVQVQRGEVAPALTTTNVGITPVASLAQAFVLYSKSVDPTDTGWNEDDAEIVDLSAPDNLQVRMSSPADTHTVAWQVVEFTDAASISVQRGSTSMAAGASTATATMTAVDPTKTFVLASFRTAGMGNDIGARMITASLTNATTITFERDATGDALDEIHWQAVELKDGSRVQHGVATLAMGAASESATVTALDTARSTAFTSVELAGGQGYGRTPYVVDDLVGVATVTAEIGGPTSVNLQRGSSVAGASFAWFAVEWGAGGGAAVCGNGIIETGEACDSQPCCNACSLSGAGNLCRPSLDPSCDPLDACSGDSPDCPADVNDCTGGPPPDAANPSDGSTMPGRDGGGGGGGDGGGNMLNGEETTSALACRAGRRRGGSLPAWPALLAAIALSWIRRATLTGPKECRSRLDSSGSARAPAAPTRSSTPSCSSACPSPSGTRSAPRG